MLVERPIEDRPQGGQHIEFWETLVNRFFLGQDRVTHPLNIERFDVVLI